MRRFLIATALRPCAGLPDIYYPCHDKDILVTACERICMHRKKINISTVMAGQKLGLKEVDDAIWLVSFMTYDLGHDLRSRIYRSGAKNFANHRQPVRHQTVTHVLGTFCDLCLQVGQQSNGAG